MLKKLNFQFYLYYLLLLLFIFLGVNKVNAMPSFMPSLSAYSVSYKSSSEQYDITFVVEGGSRSCSGDIMLIGAEPLIPEPALFSCNIFNPDEFQTFNTSINNISEQVSGKLSMKIQVHKWGHIYESQYKILIIGSGNSETAPPVINFTEYIDININITNEITFVFPDSQFKLMILGAAVFTSAALYVKAESPIRNNKEEKLKFRERKGKFYALALATISYYITSENLEFSEDAWGFLYGYEYASLIIAGVIYFVVRGIFSSRPTIGITRIMGAQLLIALFIFFYKEFVLSLVLGIIGIIILIIAGYLSYSHQSDNILSFDESNMKEPVIKKKRRKRIRITSDEFF